LLQTNYANWIETLGSSFARDSSDSSDSLRSIDMVPVEKKITKYNKNKERNDKRKAEQALNGQPAVKKTKKPKPVKQEQILDASSSGAFRKPKKPKYFKKAEKLGITVEEYVRRKEAPNVKSDEEELRIKSDAEVESAYIEKKQKAAEVKYIVEPEPKSEEGQPAFTIDTEGDVNITQVNKTLWEPSMLGDRTVKQLSKEERLARKEWLRERRRQRKLTKIAQGRPPPPTKKERQKKKVQRKMKERDQLVAQIMTEAGRSKKSVSKGELKDARRKAKKKQKDAKKLKRNKVIHRNVIKSS